MNIFLYAISIEIISFILTYFIGVSALLHYNIYIFLLIMFANLLVVPAGALIIYWTKWLSKSRKMRTLYILISLFVLILLIKLYLLYMLNSSLGNINPVGDTLNAVGGP